VLIKDVVTVSSQCLLEAFQLEGLQSSVILCVNITDAAANHF